MRQPGGALLLVILLLLASCTSAGSGPLSGLMPGASPVRQTALPPTADPTGLPIPQVVIQSPLHIDGEDGRLYAQAQVNGQPRLVTLDAGSGRLLQSWDMPGKLALDAVRNRLAVDRGLQGVAIIDGATGVTLTHVTLPPQDDPPPPQSDEETGLVYAFREATVFVIDPARQTVIRSAPLAIAQTICDAPAGDAPVADTAFNNMAGHLYLTFITARCVPWATATIVVLNAADLAEIGRFEVDPIHQFTAYGDSLFGRSINRLGPTLFWTWDAQQPGLEQSSEYQGALGGMFLDSERKLIYEAYGETIRILDPRALADGRPVTVPLLSETRLAGHDPVSDLLYFVSPTGRLYLWPAGQLTAGQSSPVAAESPFPIAPVRAIALPTNWATAQTMAALIDNGDCPVDGGRLFIMTGVSNGWIESHIGPDGACDAVAVVAFSPAYATDSLIFAAANQPATILRSVDAGRSWTAAETPFPAGTTFNALIPSPAYASDQTLYALTTDGSLYHSRDGGRAWRLLDQRLDRLTVAGGVGPALHLYGAYGRQILRSRVGGTEWVAVGDTLGGEPLELLASAPSTGDWPILYAFTDGGRFARSLDGGVSWAPVMETGPAPAQLVIAAAVPEATRPIFLLHEQWVEASYDGMASIWSAPVSDEASRYRPTTLALSPDFAAAPYLFVGTADGQIIRIPAGITP